MNKHFSKYIITGLFILVSLCSFAQVSKVWVSDNGDGTYTNPVIHADYSDPDAIRVGDDFYMISSSFNHAPGLPILHSKDLVNWKLIGYALHKIIPVEHFNSVQHGSAVWAPSIRFHKGEFYIYYPDPDFGIYVIKSKHIQGPWSEPQMVEAGKGLIDPCPLWDDNGKTYLVHAFAGSRAGTKSIIVVKEMNTEGTRTITNGVLVYDGHQKDPTIEGPKFHKRNGYYYIFAPAGGVATGWQLVLRSKNVYGPYERKVVMDQGNSAVNGPHQGAWVQTSKGEDWFLHFQDREEYGRVVHLQPMVWKNNWPVIGIDEDADGKGTPVSRFRKPVAGQPISTVPDADEFNGQQYGLQWQWQANPKPNWGFITSMGTMRLICLKQDSTANYWNLPNMLLQKIPAEQFTATTRIKFSPASIGDRVAFTVFGLDYAYVSLYKKSNTTVLTFNTCLKADKSGTESESEITSIHQDEIYFRLSMKKGICQFSYSLNGNEFISIEKSFSAKPGKWVGAKLGFFSTGKTKTNDSGYGDIDWIRFEK